MISHPAVWTNSTRIDDFVANFDKISVAEIQDRLENGSGALLLRGFNLEGLKKNSAREAFLEWCQTIGTPVSQSTSGDLVFNVEDAGLAENDPGNRGPNTRKKLSFHTDRCDVIAFLCWKQALSGGENEIVSSMHLYNEIEKERPDLLEILQSTFVYKRHTVDGGNEKAYCEQPVFSFCDEHFACSFLRVLIARADADPALPNLSAQQREALDYLEEVAGRSENAIRFLQKPGDILLLNNWVTLHRRSAFTDHLETEEKRCLFRIWLSMPNSRPLVPDFLDNYGAVGAGEIRGGMKAAV
ncbi:MAG: TauD/TfdA family dioxygenase [Verrucomicrobiales bacterium]|nr:TauD/TfdA family dioxygenase [Verrucomicrobiales bacterium]